MTPGNRSPETEGPSLDGYVEQWMALRERTVAILREVRASALEEQALAAGGRGGGPVPAMPFPSAGGHSLPETPMETVMASAASHRGRLDSVFTSMDARIRAEEASYAARWRAMEGTTHGSGEHLEQQSRRQLFTREAAVLRLARRTFDVVREDYDVQQLLFQAISSKAPDAEFTSLLMAFEASSMAQQRSLCSLAQAAEHGEAPQNGPLLG
uniref:Uncharacterized protein n=1 Tax=Rhizochromulina marina TaxID=1034831 RepID=A0A7S2SEN7_9STRA|mmetsp:Transcript_29111/g.84993  ORF Transcript_29111/g.84993 Transcript_29111/m.84993 type:complete len:212 (+) Transcript_29111:90-725(+)|eukprot:CAMPEP_0118975400 /NCGR_PEP_ID=MMETSP1173-20130426/15597_1 /TAXON_ID=1034831 /ORGANISM="Rhizochromulina marina cf, Strain CCMP1243" /LENGTH=211 /DNA_ID=CAMNT_0006925279 /DNA_START=22 /DNA_END=657 /DNA_ORIENTATION=-